MDELVAVMAEVLEGLACAAGKTLVLVAEDFEHGDSGTLARGWLLLHTPEHTSERPASSAGSAS